MEVKIIRREIIKVGGSYVITLAPQLLKKAGFVLGDIVDIKLEHSKDFGDEEQVDNLFAKIAAKKMKEKGLTEMTIKLNEVDDDDEKQNTE